VNALQNLIAEAIAFHGILEPPVRGDYPTRRLWVRAVRDWGEALTWSSEQRSKARQMDVVVRRELAKRGSVVWSSSDPPELDALFETDAQPSHSEGNPAP
jgi:hypothetical protein